MFFTNGICISDNPDISLIKRANSRLVNLTESDSFRVAGVGLLDAVHTAQTHTMDEVLGHKPLETNELTRESFFLSFIGLFIRIIIWEGDFARA